MKRIGFIGPGKVGCSLGRYISENCCGFNVSGYYGRNEAATAEAAAFAGGSAFKNAEELAMACDLLLLTVPDGQIANVWDTLATFLRDRDEPLYVGHCSGSQNSEIFQPKAGCHFGSIHPILAVHDKETSYKNFGGAYFTIEGDETFKDIAGGLLSALGNPYETIEASQKILYHAASVMISNLVCALTYEGMETFKACGLSNEFADKAWRSLFFGNAENIKNLGPVRALTGPVERGDAETVAKHLAALSGEAREVYLLLSRTLTETASRKNPDRDYSKLIQLLKDIQ